MSKKSKKKFQRAGSVFYMTAEEATLSQMPKFNAYAGGHGVHGDRKYNRTAAKREFRKEMGW